MSIVILKSLFLKEKVTVNKNTLFKNLSRDKTIHKFGESGTRLAFKFSNGLYGGQLNESYFKLTINRFETHGGLDAASYGRKTYETLETSP